MCRYGLLHRLLYDLLQRSVCAGGRRRGRGCRPDAALLCQQLRYRGALDIGAGGDGGKVPQQILELGVIVGPGVLPQHFQRPGLKAGQLLSQFQIQVVQVQACQRGDLVGAAAEGGQSQGHAAQPLPKGAHHRRHRRPFLHCAGKDQPHPPCQTRLLDDRQQLLCPGGGDGLEVLEVHRVAVGVQGRIVVVQQKIPAPVVHHGAVDHHHGVVDQ